MYALSAAIHQNRSRAWTYCCYVASSLGTHALAICRSQKNSRSAGLSGYAWIQPARQPKLVVPSQPFIDTLFRSVRTEILQKHILCSTEWVRAIVMYNGRVVASHESATRLIESYPGYTINALTNKGSMYETHRTQQFLIVQPRTRPT